MGIYLIGDVQGCDRALGRLLDEISFSASRDTLYLLGDLVNRGPDSLGVLRRLIGYGASAQCLLGNHDLHLLALAFGARKPGRHDTLQEVLAAPDWPALLHWLRQQRMAILERVQGHEVLMVHAGVLPGWSATQTIALGREVEAVLRGPDLGEFLKSMYGNEPAGWQDGLTGVARLRVIVNALTRLRFCDTAGNMEFTSTQGADAAPPGFMPWFDVPARLTASVTVAFGHWSTLGWQDRSDILALDTGCVWGGCLSAVRIADQGRWHAPQLIQVKCEQAQKPG